MDHERLAVMPDSPKLGKITRHNGIAGQFSYSVMTTYPGEPSARVEFVGSVYGGTIIMVTDAGTQIPISSRVTDRIGSTLDPAWIRSFFAPREDASA